MPIADLRKGKKELRILDCGFQKKIKYDVHGIHIPNKLVEN